MKPVEIFWIRTGFIFFIVSIIAPFFITDDVAMRWWWRAMILSVFAIPFGIYGVIITWNTTYEERMQMWEDEK